LKKFHNRNLIDWRNWSQSLLAKIYKFGLADRRVGSGRRRSTRTLLFSNR